MRRLLLLVLAVPLFACPPANPPDVPDGGSDAGGDAGEDAGVAGQDGGVDAGPGNPDLTCDVPSQTGCDAGTCLLHALADGGFGSRCFPGACDLVAQDCPGAQKCSYISDGGPVVRGCVADGTVSEGQPCQGSPTQNNCRKGLMCALRTGPDGGLEPACLKFCHNTGSCTSPNLCYVVLTVSGTDERPMVCGAPPPTCDLLAQDCPQTHGCYPSTPSPMCFTAGGKPNGAACVYSNDCARGSACIGSGASGVCRQLCQYPSGAPTCSAGACTRLSAFPDAGACL